MLKLIDLFNKLLSIRTVITLSVSLAVIASYYFFLQGDLIAYGDAESHLNISKRVVHSLNPGLAQLGGIWLPLPHLLMVPFVYFDTLWQSGLAGSIVSGFFYVVSAIYIFKLVHLFTKSNFASFVGFLIFALNPNILYLQSTAMTEVPLIAFFLLSTYYFIKYLFDQNDILALVLAGVFGFGATLSRYDGWFLVATQASVLVLYYLIKNKDLKELEGKVIIFSTVAFFGIFLWFLWDYLILGDPFYFTNSPFSAKSQQSGWLARGELPSYRDLTSSLLYYSVTSYRTIGIYLSAAASLGLLIFLISRNFINRLLVTSVLMVPFVFYVITLFMGQSVIFIPELTPDSFEWNLFNVRYGVMMVPVAAFFVGILLNRSKPLFKPVIIMILMLQTYLFFSGASAAISHEDAISGLSSSGKRLDVETWLADNYDGGLVLADDYARTVSIIRAGISTRDAIYIGNKPYWEESLENPEKYARWIVMQHNDDVWKNFLDDPVKEGRLYAHFEKVYTSPEILVFKKADETSSITSN